ncbi:MAG: iron-sulfur cluster-binding domain-containing protein [Ruminococcaceae bacterium]|nr:iron-sulfur cluster-binding domain-containing protein [Oscillospiraceae bacterium]
MAEHDLNSLDPMAFTRLVPTREAHFAKAEPKNATEYPPNRLARILHPDCQHLTVAAIEDNTDSAKTYTLKGRDGSVAYFDAGQYLSLSLKIGDVVTTRPYSIASSPRESLEGVYKITVKRVEGGLASNYILDNWTVGSEVTASAPLGFFTYEPLRDADTVIAVAGGSGITPFLSLARAIDEGAEELSLTILYGSRRESDILHRAELDEIAGRCSKVKVVYVLSEEEKEGFERGFIDAELIRKYAPDTVFSVFLCGPAGMYSFVDGELEALSLERKYIRHEVHGESYDPEGLRGYPGACAETVKITVKQGNTERTVTGSNKDTILRILEKASIAAPSHCRSGECGFCRSRLVSGRVFIPEESDRRRLADEPYGYIHPCCTYPLTDLEIEVALS